MLRVAYYIDGCQPYTSCYKRYGMCYLTVEDPCQEGQQQQPEDGCEKVIPAEHTAYKVGPFVIQYRCCIRGAVDTSCYGRRGIYPHRKECKPGEELHHGQLSHGQRHPVQVCYYAYQSRPLPAMMYIQSADKLQYTKDSQSPGKYIKLFLQPEKNDGQGEEAPHNSPYKSPLKIFARRLHRKCFGRTVWVVATVKLRQLFG